MANALDLALDDLIQKRKARGQHGGAPQGQQPRRAHDGDGKGPVIVKSFLPTQQNAQRRGEAAGTPASVVVKTFLPQQVAQQLQPQPTTPVTQPDLPRPGASSGSATTELLAQLLRQQQQSGQQQVYAVACPTCGTGCRALGGTQSLCPRCSSLFAVPKQGPSAVQPPAGLGATPQAAPLQQQQQQQHGLGFLSSPSAQRLSSDIPASAGGAQAALQDIKAQLETLSAQRQQQQLGHMRERDQEQQRMLLGAQLGAQMQDSSLADPEQAQLEATLATAVEQLRAQQQQALQTEQEQDMQRQQQQSIARQQQAIQQQLSTVQSMLTGQGRTTAGAQRQALTQRTPQPQLQTRAAALSSWQQRRGAAVSQARGVAAPSAGSPLAIAAARGSVEGALSGGGVSSRRQQRQGGPSRPRTLSSRFSGMWY
eukprot:TRINITY_DN13741_c0_g1_i1.p1 TRINITY_DN13741_c0_g1~~TRINITY_DN13741_c0_g1_i1.p1  ORF type:complete len:459 (+),score=146.71 TRINITY_DN13741_c0_g1_i1:105-1379(+)